jgi:hypothetical protein
VDDSVGYRVQTCLLCCEWFRSQSACWPEV